MKTYYGLFYVGQLSFVKEVRALSVEKATDLCRRYAKAAGRVTHDDYSFRLIYETYPAEYMVTEGQVSDLEYMAVRMRKESRWRTK